MVEGECTGAVCFPSRITVFFHHQVTTNKAPKGEVDYCSHPAGDQKHVDHHYVDA